MREFVLFEPSRDGRIVERDLKRLGSEARAALLEAMLRWEEAKGFPNETSTVSGHPHLWEMRVSIGRQQYRVLFAVEGERACALTAFHKKSQAIRQEDMNRAEARYRAWRASGYV